MRLWTDFVYPLRDEAGYTYDQAAHIAALRTHSLALRRLDLTKALAKAWEHRWRFDMTYQAGIEQLLRDRLAAHGLPH